jgi:heptosyltransferase-3
MKIIGKSNYKPPENIRNILLIQLGDIGDVVWTTPSIWAAKKSIPGLKVSVMVKEGFGGLLEADPSVEQIIEVKRYHGNMIKQTVGQLSFLKDLRFHHFDLVVDLRLGDRGAFMAFATGAAFRVTAHNTESVPFWRKYFFTHGIVPGPPVHTRGAADQSLCILRELGIDTDNIIPRLWVSDAVKKRVQEILTNEKIDRLKNWVTINPFSRWQYKEWNVFKWAEIIDWLWEEYRISVVIVGAPEEKLKAEALIKQCKYKVFNFAGKTTLKELAGVLRLSSLHIGVDSAAPHIAAATGTPTVSIYGPSNWEDWAPIGDNHRVILPDMDCVPCRKKGCDHSGYSRCLEALSADQVKSVIRETIKAAKRENSI